MNKEEKIIKLSEINDPIIRVSKKLLKVNEFNLPKINELILNIIETSLNRWDYTNNDKLENIYKDILVNIKQVIMDANNNDLPAIMSTTNSIINIFKEAVENYKTTLIDEDTNTKTTIEASIETPKTTIDVNDETKKVNIDDAFKDESKVDENVVVEKPKRKRRTKAEMELARQQEATMNNTSIVNDNDLANEEEEDEDEDIEEQDETPIKPTNTTNFNQFTNQDVTNSIDDNKIDETITESLLDD